MQQHKNKNSESNFRFRFDEVTDSAGICKSGEKCIGGFSRLYKQIDTALKHKPNAIVLNAGDDFSGTLWYTIGRWNITQEFMNQIKFEASVCLIAIIYYSYTFIIHSSYYSICNWLTCKLESRNCSGKFYSFNRVPLQKKVLFLANVNYIEIVEESMHAKIAKRQY